MKKIALLLCVVLMLSTLMVGCKKIGGALPRVRRPVRGDQRTGKHAGNRCRDLRPQHGDR